MTGEVRFVKAHLIRKNDWIICPARGHREQVTTGAQKRLGDRVFFRTDHHDHNVHRNSMIEIAETPVRPTERRIT